MFGEYSEIITGILALVSSIISYFLGKKKGAK